MKYLCTAGRVCQCLTAGPGLCLKELQQTGCPLKRVTTGKCYSSSELAVGDKQVSLVANETSGGWESLDSFQMGHVKETKRSGKSGNWRFTSMSS